MNSNAELTLALAAVTAITAAIVFVAFATKHDHIEQKEEVVKIGPAASFERVQGLMDYRFKGMKEASRQIVWDFQGTQFGEQDMFLSFELKTKAEKKAFRDEAVKNGGKRLLNICYNLQSDSGEWSMGYCYNKPAPHKGAKS